MKPTFLRKTLTLIPEPGQRGRLPKVHGGRWRGNIRAVSEPYTDARGAVVIPVAEEDEYGAALREGRHAIGIPWPAQQMEAVWPSEDTGEGRNLFRGLRQGAQSRGGRLLGAEPETEQLAWGRVADAKPNAGQG